ncbi:YiaA/YiaB family inner membrane protein [Antarcticirhabdus aurantiaca]|uniref:YiaA/YiaB family inner membrane protein n=1 Tax=Antarcticirhabdus aurantiaca TaxID=2606717 RepID=A0ACD4NMZ5_9HYPH|nr:YiaA/YiaB family inner membrane protein [Antarcticirhabdus aurantiaca]WAJ28330.1 YiaA/YiaB family inner membrane protein [Jeongeuplla avenae]
MTESYTPKHTAAWKGFTIISFAIAAGMMAAGIWSLEASFAAKGFYAMASVMLVHSAITVTKTLRDEEEASRFLNRLEEARTEKLLMGAERRAD